jgi:Ca-activated chloride channel family protein
MMEFPMRFLAAILLCLVALPVAAQERPKAILVLDGSGSMWGQIDGKAKITIAQDVVGELLVSLPDTQDLGLTVYGHRRKGDCADIETIVEPGQDSRAAIAAAVNGIKPKGKTPMTDAVVAAAEALRYAEDKATVILVSDGIETCEPDPCAIARMLEETGVDFTAHVIGFDVKGEAEALAQMQCLAEETERGSL